MKTIKVTDEITGVTKELLFMEMYDEFNALSEEDKQKFKHQLKESNKISLNCKVYEFGADESNAFKRCEKIAIR